MPDDTHKTGRGGKRPGAGRPVGTKKQPGKQYTVYLDAASAARLDRQAVEAGVTPYAWIAQAIRRILEDTP